MSFFTTFGTNFVTLFVMIQLHDAKIMKNDIKSK